MSNLKAIKRENLTTGSTKRLRADGFIPAILYFFALFTVPRSTRWLIMKDRLDEEKVQRIWKRSIMPYIEDYFFDDPDQAAEFSYDHLRNDTQP